MKPGYKANFMTNDGLEFQINVIRKDDILSHKDNDEVKVVVTDDAVEEKIENTNL